MLHLDFCTQILELSAPWQVDSIKIDQPSRRLDIFIGFDASRKRSRFSLLPQNGMFSSGLFNSGLFSSSRQPTCPHCHSVLPENNVFEKVCLRHLPIAGMQTYLHVPAPGTVQSRQPNCFCMRTWTASGTEFTEAMRDYVLTLLRALPDGKSAAQLAGISYNEVRQICRASNFTAVSPELQIKNQQLLKNEIEMLYDSGAAGSATLGESETNGNLPAEDERIWQALINGEVILPTDTVSLKMLLTRVRQVITRDPTDANRREGARALRQYFRKNQHRLAADIRCLKTGESEGRSQLPAGDAPDCLVPSIAHPGWQRLIDGEIQIAADSVALRMLLVQIRQSLEKNQGVSRKLACTKLLRNYFLKHQSRHRQDLERLAAS